MSMQWLRLGLGALVLAVSTGVQAVVTWQVDILPEGVSTPPGIVFDGNLKVNIHGVGIHDVPITNPIPPDVAPSWDVSIGPLAINDLGQVVGSIFIGGGLSTTKPFIAYNGVTTVLWDVVERGYAAAINNHGQVVGYRYEGASGFSWGGPPVPEWYEDPVYGIVGIGAMFNINDAGQILAQVNFAHDGYTEWRNAVLTPVPEPHAAWLLAAGALALFLRRRRQ